MLTNVDIMMKSQLYKTPSQMLIGKTDCLITDQIVDTKDKGTTPVDDSITMPPNQSNTSWQWPTGTKLVVGASMLGGIEESRFGTKRKVCSFPAANTEDMYQYMVPFYGRNRSVWSLAWGQTIRHSLLPNKLATTYLTYRNSSNPIFPNVWL